MDRTWNMDVKLTELVLDKHEVGNAVHKSEHSKNGVEIPKRIGRTFSRKHL
jgi:metal-dependent HD superfamily phosphatase/phosphodiesterase